MGQKVNPHGFRVGVIKDWDSRWFARPDKVGDLIVEDYNIRKYLKGLLFQAGVPKIEIERDSTKVKILLHCSRPGVVIGKGGTEIERLRLEMEKRLGKPVSLSIIEVKNPDTDAQLVAESIAAKLEKRIGFRRAMKNAMQRAMRLGVRGIKVMVAGRLGGAEIARSEMYHEGTIPLQTIRADIEYGFAEAATTYGRIGVKVWIYNGEILNQSLRTTPRTMDLTKPPRERRPDNRGDRNDKGGYNRGGQGGYNNNRPAGTTGGYNNNRPAGTTGGYNNNRPAGTTGGYTNNRPAGTTGGYNNNRPAGQGGYNNNYRPAAPGGAAPGNFTPNNNVPNAAPNTAAPSQPVVQTPKEGGTN